jgi:PrcB C-terminal
MKPFLFSVLLAALTSASLAQTAPPKYSVSDITLYGLNERFALFSGETGTIRQGGTTLNLTRAVGTVAGLDVAGGLRVNGLGALPLPAPKLTAFNLTRSAEGLRLTTRVPLTAVYYFDGEGWFTLSETSSGGLDTVVRPVARVGLYGAGTMTLLEAKALEGYLRAQNTQIVIGVIPVAPSPASFTPAPQSYRRTALAVQLGVFEANSFSYFLSLTDQPPPAQIPPQEPQVFTNLNSVPVNNFATTNTIGSGSQSAYTSQELAVRLDATPEAFDATWAIVSGNVVPATHAPFIDFERSKVVTVFLGQRATGGYGLRLLSANLEAGGTMQLQLETSEPRAGSITTQAFTSPYLMLEVSSQVKEVVVTLVPAGR